MTGPLVSSAVPPATLPGPVAASACLLVSIGVVAWLAPGFSRPGSFFSVAVQPWLRATPEGRRVLRSYRFEVQLHTLIGFLLLALPYPAAGTSVPWFLAALAGLGWQLGGCFFAYQAARRQVLPHGVDQASVREAETLRQRVRPPGGWTLQAAPFAALAGAALYLGSHWTDLPERFPVHWGPDGRPNGWADRHLAVVLAPLLVAAVVAGSMALFAVLLRRDRNHRGTHDVEAAAAERRFRRTVLGAVLATEYLLVGISIWVSLLPFVTAAAGSDSGPPSVAPLAALILIFVVMVTIVLARSGHAARLAAARDRDANRQPGDSPESRWKAGIFYVNPDDPALFVQKRFGIGYTLNFGRPLSWLILGLSILAPLAVAAWVLHAAR